MNGINTFFITKDKPEVWSRVFPQVDALIRLGKKVRVRVDEGTGNRTLAMNAKMWAILRDIAEQVDWPVDGELQKLIAEDWKEILTAGLKKHQRMVKGMDGGVVMIGMRTSKMTIEQMSDLIELAQAFGSEHNVRWSA